jgi:hypothetical protein
MTALRFNLNLPHFVGNQVLMWHTYKNPPGSGVSGWLLQQSCCSRAAATELLQQGCCNRAAATGLLQ